MLQPESEATFCSWSGRGSCLWGLTLIAERNKIFSMPGWRTAGRQMLTGLIGEWQIWQLPPVIDHMSGTAVGIVISDSLYNGASDQLMTWQGSIWFSSDGSYSSLQTVQPSIVQRILEAPLDWRSSRVSMDCTGVYSQFSLHNCSLFQRFKPLEGCSSWIVVNPYVAFLGCLAVYSQSCLRKSTWLQDYFIPDVCPIIYHFGQQLRWRLDRLQ